MGVYCLFNNDKRAASWILFFPFSSGKTEVREKKHGFFTCQREDWFSKQEISFYSLTLWPFGGTQLIMLGSEWKWVLSYQDLNVSDVSPKMGRKNNKQGGGRDLSIGRELVLSLVVQCVWCGHTAHYHTQKNVCRLNTQRDLFLEPSQPPVATWLWLSQSVSLSFSSSY